MNLNYRERSNLFVCLQPFLAVLVYRPLSSPWPATCQPRRFARTSFTAAWGSLKPLCREPQGHVKLRKCGAFPSGFATEATGPETGRGRRALGGLLADCPRVSKLHVQHRGSAVGAISAEFARGRIIKMGASLAGHFA